MTEPTPSSSKDDQNEDVESIDEQKDEESKEASQPPSLRAPVMATGALPLDWTRVTLEPRRDNDEEEGAPMTDHDHPTRYPWDVTDIDANDEEDLVIVGTAGQKITRMGIDLSQRVNPNIKQLVLRSHLIRVMEGIGGFSQLELLELYDNVIEVLTALNEGAGGSPGSTLTVLDMSYNVIRDMTPVSFCPNLRELYLANNKLRAITGLKSLTQLVKIDLGANRIRVMAEEELSELINLEELWLGKNKIEKIEGLEKLTKLRRLDVQSNRLTEVEGLTTQVNTLEELYLAHNGITNEGASKATGLALKFGQLSTLDLSRNFLTSTQPFAHLTSVEELWLSGNKIGSFDQVQPLSGLSLETIYLEYNPLQDDFEYRKKLKEMIPSLTQIDATLVGGLAAQGLQSAANRSLQAETLEDQMRRLQEAALKRARDQQ